MDRVAVPLLFVAGVVFTVACLRAPVPVVAGRTGAGGRDSCSVSTSWAGYQVTWLLMFADYPRFVRSARGAGLAVFAGLALTALWFMPLGLIASALAHSFRSRNDGLRTRDRLVGSRAPGAGDADHQLREHLHVGTRIQELRPSIGDGTAVWLIGGIGAALGLLSNTWIEQFAGLTLLLAGVFVPIGGILLAHLRRARPGRARSRFVQSERTAGGAPRLVHPRGDGLDRWRSRLLPGTGIGGSLPSLAVSIAVYVALIRPVHQSDVATTPALRSEPSA